MDALLHPAGPATTADEFEHVTLRSADGTTEADFVPAANLVCCSLSHHGLEVLHQGEGVAAYARRGATMGVPLLHPWANRLDGFSYEVDGRSVVLPRGENLIPLDNRGLPIHGALPALMSWELTSVTRERLKAALRWNSQAQLRLFPFPHELTVETTVEDGRLTIATTLAPTGAESVPVSFGYHPYLRIPDVPRNQWRVRLGAHRRLCLDGAMIPTGEHEPVASRCFSLREQDLDGGFDELAVPPEFEAASGDVTVGVEFLEGYPYAQVYAPADQDFICFEPMTAPTNALVSGDALRLVRPGERYRAAFRISLSAAEPHN
jgi:galactose mutarotase-like enzyme